MDKEIQLVPMVVKGLIMDQNTPVVVLQDQNEARLLPIWIGPAEANAIMLEIEGVRPPRPLTHDLIINTLTSLDAQLVQIVISDLRDGTFYAALHLQTSGGDVEVDSRPSDAIALALRVDAPVLVAEPVLDAASQDQRTERLKDDATIKKYLEDLDDDDLGDYEM
ncbi:MAG: bifunctional nuclease family protein [Acidobacteriota bacterium]